MVLVADGRGACQADGPSVEVDQRIHAATELHDVRVASLGLPRLDDLVEVWIVGAWDCRRGGLHNGQNLIELGRRHFDIGALRSDGALARFNTEELGVPKGLLRSRNAIILVLANHFLSEASKI